MRWVSCGNHGHRLEGVRTGGASLSSKASVLRWAFAGLWCGQLSMAPNPLRRILNRDWDCATWLPPADRGSLELVRGCPRGVGCLVRSALQAFGAICPSHQKPPKRREIADLYYIEGYYTFDCLGAARAACYPNFRPSNFSKSHVLVLWSEQRIRDASSSPVAHREGAWFLSDRLGRRGCRE